MGGAKDCKSAGGLRRPLPQKKEEKKSCKQWLQRFGSPLPEALTTFPEIRKPVKTTRFFFWGVGLWLKVESSCFVPPDSVILTLALEVGRALDPS